METYWPASSSTTPRYAGLVSFFRLPPKSEPKDAGIALIGLPHDGGTTKRAGTRHGSRALRKVPMPLRPFHQVTETAPCLTRRVADFGDCPIDPIDIQTRLSRITVPYAGFDVARCAPLSAGDDHPITLPVPRALAAKGPVGVIQFVACSDPNDRCFGGHRYTHGTWGRRAIDAGPIDPRRCAQIGAAVVEVCPPFAPSGNTALVGASMRFDLLCVLSAGLK